ncbi:MAG: HAD family hydrolase [Clostridia bacterium]|nr:HAD family hydrolase [Clostridia bacterium]
MKGKTLYVSDLDGTLLRSDERTSAYTNETINALCARGMLFSYATARSYSTASRVTKGLSAQIPLIVYNGAFTVDNATGKILLKTCFDQAQARGMIRELLEKDIYPIVYAIIGGEEKFTYVADKQTPGAKVFTDSRRGDRRDRPVADAQRLFDGEIFYITCVDEPEKLEPFDARWRGEHHCVYQRDIYSGAQWLEIMPRDASKSRAIARLKEHLGCARVVAFGDGKNDIDMFELADESYAVENAAPELKAAATGIIARNDEDGVAKWLAKHVRPEE